MISIKSNQAPESPDVYSQLIANVEKYQWRNIIWGLPNSNSFCEIFLINNGAIPYP